MYLEEASPDDKVLQPYAYADGHDPNKLYTVEPTDDLPSELDIVLLYSPHPLGHSQYPRPAKSKLVPYSPQDIGLLAYHGTETRSIYIDYPQTTRRDLNNALNKLFPNRLTLVKAITGTRNEPGLIHHRCSSAAGASGGALVNSNGELIGNSEFGWRVNNRITRRRRMESSWCG